MPIVTTQQKQDVIISTLHRARLEQRLRVHQALKAQMAEFERELKKNTDDIEAIRADLGVKSFTFEGCNISRVEGSYKQFDKKLFVLNGGDLRVYDASQVEKPRKPYTKITAPGQKDDYGERE